MANCGRRRGSSSRPKHKKRTKYLSLKRVIIKSEVDTPPPPPPDDAPGPSSTHPPPWLDDGQQQVRKEEDGSGHLQQQQVDPFAPHHEAASTLFASVPAPSLSDILGASADSPSSSPSVSPDGVSGGAGFPAAEDDDLARRALRGRERWVYCRTGSSSPSTTTTSATTTVTTTTTTSSSSPCSSAASTGASARSPPSLLLKLDYDDILAAWADRGSLYVARAAPNSDVDGELHDVLVEEVEPTTTVGASAPGTAASGSRAESVRRYREKRRNRLFARRIRYEVRRVNAVKRPRFKGRFIKENEGIEVHPR